ncbi:MogA/MoaB family molybdenum cofactor biosynthesis protein [Leptolyngbya iicbica]|uniref:Molybdenum cofactor biosynthesis protein B n=2 Tax=Cyanophyceae TaxID=3028117 RepID=A0A4Q7EFP8_9CYAN|nr:MogA/MoaB family molybdenum cofactor biosynthesis protein [Leptolyngbya sp. LK]RZM81856.1 MogA/MoaB family molybdenum cofactor biosynthesis protein [Leptolyngbya sp. LK]
MPQPHPDAAIAVKCAVLTVSDTRTPDVDKSGNVITERLSRRRHQVVAYNLVKDEPEQVRRQILTWVAVPNIEAILVNGGTGIAPRDTTYEAIAGLLTKTLPGFGELFRMLSYEQIGSRAMASRAIAGVCKSTLIFSMPGSSKAVELAMSKLILPELIHLTTQMRGE